MYNNQEKFLNYLTKPLSMESILLAYDINNIVYDKCELYSDFVTSLLRLIFDTYMGDDITKLTSQKYEHFDWCWEENIRRFKLEGITFNNDKIKKYFGDFTYEFYYKSTKKTDESYELGCMKVWQDIFEYDKPKTKSELETLIEIYDLFENIQKRLL